MSSSLTRAQLAFRSPRLPPPRRSSRLQDGTRPQAARSSATPVCTARAPPEHLAAAEAEPARRACGDRDEARPRSLWRPMQSSRRPVRSPLARIPQRPGGARPGDRICRRCRSPAAPGMPVRPTPPLLIFFCSLHPLRFLAWMLDIARLSSNRKEMAR